MLAAGILTGSVASMQAKALNIPQSPNQMQ